MTVAACLRIASAATFCLLLCGCAVPYQTSAKVATGERSWQRSGVQYVVARRYAASLHLSEATSVRTEYAAGTLTVDGMTFPAGCHAFEVRAGDTLRLDVSGLKMSVPAQACEQTGRPRGPGSGLP